MQSPTYWLVWHLTICMMSLPPLYCSSYALFSPDDQIESHLISLIHRTNKSIRVAVYQLTSPAVAQALIDAHRRGVSIEILLDYSTIQSRFGKAKLLSSNGVSIFVYIPSISDHWGSPIMHNKFALFELDDHNAITWTGSYNWSNAANTKNQENVVVTTNKKIFIQFAIRFEAIKNRLCFETNSPAPQEKAQNGTKKDLKREWRTQLSSPLILNLGRLRRFVTFYSLITTPLPSHRLS